MRIGDRSIQQIIFGIDSLREATYSTADELTQNTNKAHGIVVDAISQLQTDKTEIEQGKTDITAISDAMDALGGRRGLRQADYGTKESLLFRHQEVLARLAAMEQLIDAQFPKSR